MNRAVGGPRPRGRSGACALLLLPALASAGAGDVPAYQRSFDLGPHRVEVDADSDGYYEIRVFRGRDLAARLAGAPKGLLAASTVADLDHDDAFEVVLLFQPAGDQNQAIRVYEWNDLFLELINLPEPVPAPGSGPRGTGRYRIDGDELLFEYSADRDGAAEAQAGGALATYRFDFEAGTWQEPRARRGWLERLPFIGDQ